MAHVPVCGGNNLKKFIRVLSWVLGLGRLLKGVRGEKGLRVLDTWGSGAMCCGLVFLQWHRRDCKLCTVQHHIGSSLGCLGSLCWGLCFSGVTWGSLMSLTRSKCG